MPPDHRVKTAHYAASGAHAQSFKELVTPDLHGGPSVLSCNLRLAAVNANEAKVPKCFKLWY